MRPPVLLVEDEAAWQELLSELLADNGFQPHAARTLPAALALLGQEHWALALLDVSLAEAAHDNREGLRVLEHFRARFPDVPALLLTGYATVELAVEALTRFGATDFLRKEQFDRRTFQATLQRALGTAPPPPSLPLPPLSPATVSLSVPLAARVLVVEDNPAWRELYREMLEECGATATFALSYGEARGLLQRQNFDVAVVDLRLASSTAPEANRDGFLLLRLTQEARLPTIVVTALGDVGEIDRAYDRFDAFAFFDKEGFQRTAFFHTLRAAATGTPSPSRNNGPLALLTERQLEVLALLAQGKTNNEIAQELIVSVNTVKKHVLAIFNALGVNTRAHAAAIAAQQGMPTEE